MTISDDLRIRRFGTSQRDVELRSIKAGPFEAKLSSGGLRAIRFRGREVIRAIEYVVRDKDWGTYAPLISNVEISQSDLGFNVTYDARCVNPESRESLSFHASISADNTGRLTFRVVALPETDFDTARCGFTILHPLEGVVGVSCYVEHGDETSEQTQFPDLISPWQPIKDIRSITHEPTPGLRVRCEMSGDVFEMEDQRAWSDASFKTYVRPLARPWPYTMKAGEKDHQSVVLEITDDCDEHSDMRGNGEASVTLGLGADYAFMPDIGIAFAPGQIADCLARPSLLTDIAPQYLVFLYDPLAGHGAEELSGYAAIVACMRSAAHPPHVRLEFAVPAQRNLSEEMQDLRSNLQISGLKIDSLLVSPSVDRQSTPPGSTWPDCPPLEEIYHAAHEVFSGVQIGGGMLSYFTELNRKRPPLDQLAFISHCTCPIVHASDDVSVMQTLETLPDITRSTRAIVGENMPYHIGPSTIGMRQNPYGSRLIPNPDGTRMTMTDRDPRQRGTFAAAWAVGYVAATGKVQLASLVPAALTGSLGLARLKSGLQQDEKFPAYYVTKILARMAGWKRVDCDLSDGRTVAAVAARDPKSGHVEVLLANLTELDRSVRVDGGQNASIKMIIDDHGECFDPVMIDATSERLDIGPYGVVLLSIE